MFVYVKEVNFIIYTLVIGKLQGMEYKGVIESQEGICQNLKKKRIFKKGSIQKIDNCWKLFVFR